MHDCTRFQTNWTGYLISVNFTAKRARDSAQAILSTGIQLIHQQGVPLAGRPSAFTKTESNTDTQYESWRRISLNPDLGTSDYVLVFEDDVAVSLQPSLVVPALSCAAYWSDRANLPFFYAGACVGRGTWNRSSFLESHAVDLAGAGGSRVLFQRRADVVCAHAIAVRRDSFSWLLRRASSYASAHRVANDQRLLRVAMDLQAAFLR